jgi:hypothetical protein
VDYLRAPDWGDELANVLGACVWQGAFHWIGGISAGLYQESTSSYVDTDGTHNRWVPITVELALEKAAGNQGFHRVTDAAFLAEKVSASALTLTITSDADSQSKTWTSAEIDALPDLPKVQVKIKPRAQKVQYMRLKLEDSAPGGSWGSGQGMKLRSVVFRVGVRPGVGRTAPAARK